MIEEGVTEKWVNEVIEKGGKRDQAMMLRAHGKAHAIAYMDQWRIAMEDWNRERANQKTRCADGTWSLD